MAAATTTVKLTNTSGATATLVSTAYGNAPTRINSGVTETFQQNISATMPGSIIYDFGNRVRLVFVWTSGKKVAARMLAAGTPVTLIDISNSAQSSESDNSFTTTSGAAYKVAADISPSSDGVFENLNVTISQPTTTTNVKLTNTSGDTATLDSTAYGNAPKTISNGTAPVSFQQNTLTNMLGSVIYDIGNKVRWVILWTDDNRVATKIVAAGTPITLMDIWNTAESSDSDNSFTTDSGEVYNASADIKLVDGVQTLTTTISNGAN